MTTEEAIRQISEYIYACDDNAISVEAGEMAISALSAIEDIKAEIAKIEIPEDVKTVDGSFAFCQALEIADIAIDRAMSKHISGKGNQ